MIARRSRIGRVEVAGVAAIALALPGWWTNPRMFFACWLAAWWYAIGLALGTMVNLWMHRLTGGRWGETLRPVGLLVARRLPWLMLLVLPLAAGLRLLYPWAADPAGWSQGLAHPEFPRWWLQPGFFWLRIVAYGLLWCWLARPASLASKGRTAASIVLYALSGSLASVDLLMSMVTGWTSTAFGLVVLSGQALGGAALTTLRLARREPASLLVKVAHRTPVARDLGNLLLMWVMTWAYLAFMEFLIIWAEDLPREIAWFLPRLKTGWFQAGAALVLLQLAVPLLALLQRRIKDRPQRLGAVAALLLLTQLLNTAWLVLPSVDPTSRWGWWPLPLLALGMTLLLLGSMGQSLSRDVLPPDEVEVQHARG
jgi:hypothetical protein